MTVSSFGPHTHRCVGCGKEFAFLVQPESLQCENCGNSIVLIVHPSTLPHETRTTPDGLPQDFGAGD